jgi:hypothetical protein
MAAVEVQVLTTPEMLPADGPDITLLDVAPSPPGPSPSGDAVQDVVVELPGPREHDEPLEPLRLSFDTAAAGLTHSVAEVCDSFYVLAGMRGLTELERAFHGTGRASAFGGMLLPVNGRGDPIYLGAERSPLRHKLVLAFGAYIRELPARRTAMQDLVESAAARSALARLNASRAQIVQEARRYLSLSQREEAASVFLSSGVRTTQLTGPDVPGLALDLRRIAAAREEMNRTEKALSETVARWNEGKRSVVEQELERLQARHGYLTERQIMDVARAYELGGPAAEQRAAQRTVDQQRIAVASLVAELGARRPVLFRIWDGDLPFQVRDALLAGRATNIVQQRAVLTDLVPLREAVYDALETAWTASGEMLRRFGEEPVTCWRFRALVESTLTELHADESNAGWRAAQDRIDQEQPGGELAVVSTWLGHVALAAWLAGPGAGYLMAVATVAQLAVDLVKIIVKALAVHEQRLSLDAFLSPSAGFVVDPTYSSLAVDVLWLTLGLALGRGEFRKVLAL